MYQQLKCFWCGAVMRPWDDHHLWCSEMPRDLSASRTDMNTEQPKQAAQRALYAAPVAAQPPSHSVIAGALFDFMGWLTTRKERLCLSSADDASPAVTAITEFAKMRSLSLDNAMVTDWQSGAAQASKPLRLGGPCRDHAHRTKDR
jgi:hypothetical protein